MINMLLGAPGGGKSYEAVAFHIIPALDDGRMVITNLPLVLDAFPPEHRRLLVLLQKTTKPKPERPPTMDEIRASGKPAHDLVYSDRAFSNIEDYGAPWRHAESGIGPLYVIDECHLCLPRARTQTAVAEWFSLHRHELADVLLITQSYGKVCKDIVDIVQVCYRVRKAVAFGFQSKYIRKVLDGVRGEVMNENVRTYDKKYFKFYRSHTRSSKAAEELSASDIVPIWRRWPVIGAALLLPAGCAGMIFAGNPMKMKETKPKPQQHAVAKVEAPVSPSSAPAPVAPQVSMPPQPEVQLPKGHPLAGLGLHIAGFVSNASHGMYLFLVSQNGQAIYTMNQVDLETSGYSVKHMNDCIAQVAFQAVHFYVTCDAPRVGVNPAATMPGNTESKPAA